MIGSFAIGSLNLAVAIISRDVTPENEFAIFILLLLLVMTFGSTLGPAAWVLIINLFIFRVLYLS